MSDTIACRPEPPCLTRPSLHRADKAREAKESVKETAGAAGEKAHQTKEQAKESASRAMENVTAMPDDDESYIGSKKLRLHANASSGCLPARVAVSA